MPFMILGVASCAALFGLRGSAKPKRADQGDVEGFHPQATRHPVDCIDDKALAVASFMVATLDEEFACPKRVEHGTVDALVILFGSDHREAHAHAAFGRWIADGGDGAETLRKLSRRVVQLGGRSLLTAACEQIGALCGQDHLDQMGTLPCLPRLHGRGTGELAA